MHGEEGFEASLAVQPIWPEVVRWELPSVMGGLGLIGTLVGKSSKIEARPDTIQGGVGNGRLGGLMATLETQRNDPR